MYAAKLSIFFDQTRENNEKKIILLHSDKTFLSYNLIISVLLPIICLVAFQLMSIKGRFYPLFAVVLMLRTSCAEA